LIYFYLIYILLNHHLIPSYKNYILVARRRTGFVFVTK